MQRVNILLKRRFRSADRGASAVIVALMMVPIMILAALAIDVGAMHADRQQLQTGADAGALAIAQDCARGDCTTAAATAQTMAAANLNATGAIGEIATLDATAGLVSVQTRTLREHWFAPIIGIDSTTVQSQSSARWGYPTGGTAVMPLAISWCELERQTGITVVRNSTGAVTGVDIPASTPARTILLANLSNASATDCDGPSGDSAGGVNGKLPGGFGWLTPSGQSCARTVSVINGWVGSDTGNSAPSVCTNAHFRGLVGQTVLLPIYDRTTGTGSNGRYRIFGYAAFTLTGYNFAGQYGHPSPAPCSGSDRCIRGSFDRFVDLTEDFDYSPSGPRLGAAVVALTE